MKLIDNPFFLSLKFFIFSFFFQACNEDAYTPEKINGDSLSFSVELKVPDVKTRSEDGEIKYEPANGMESKIGNDDICLLMFTSEGMKVIYDSAKLTDHVIEEGSNSEMTFKISLNRQDSYSGVRFLAVVNCKDVLSGDIKFSNEEEIRNTKYDFSNLILNYEGKYYLKENIDRIPMTGEISFSYDELKESEFNPDKKYEIPLTRLFAKISIEDKIPSDWVIKEIKLKKFLSDGYLFPSASDEDTEINYKQNLVFSKTDETDKNLHYVYLPEMKLDDLEEEDSNRKIQLTLVNTEDSSDQREAEMLIKHYTTVEPGEEWESLERNHVYKFSVTSFDPSVPEEPEIEITSTIRILWIRTAYGKFGEASYYPQDRINFRKYNDIPIFPNNPSISVDSRIEYDSNLKIIGDVAYFDLNCEEYGISKLDDIYYIITHEAQYTNYIEEDWFKLTNDIVKIETREVNNQDIMYCWLNSPTYEYHIDNSVKTLRIYVKKTSKPISADVGWDYFTSFEEEQNYYYFEISIDRIQTYLDRKIQIDYSIKFENSSEDFSDYFIYRDIFIPIDENGNQKPYYCFYAN